jgi:hypothetical protein
LISQADLPLVSNRTPQPLSPWSSH